MAFYDTYGDSKRAAQKNRLERDAQTIQAVQAMANFLQKGRENSDTARYQQQTADAAMLRAGFMPAQQNQVAPQLNRPFVPEGGLRYLTPAQAAINPMAQQSQQVQQQPISIGGKQWVKNPDYIEPNSFEDYARKESIRRETEAQRMKQTKLNAILSRKLNEKESEFLGTAPILLEKIDALIPQLGSKDEQWSYAPYGGFQKGAQNFKADLSYIRNIILKARSGGAITDGEAQRLLENFPTLTGRKEADQRKLETFRKEIIGTARRIKYGTLDEEGNALLAEYLGESAPSDTSASSAPQVGGTFNGQKVLKVTQVQ